MSPKFRRRTLQKRIKSTKCSIVKHFVEENKENKFKVKITLEMDFLNPNLKPKKK
jgi:hypothetical protein